MNRKPLEMLLLLGFVIILAGCAPDTIQATIAVTRVAVVAGTNTAVASPTLTTTPTPTINPTPVTTPSPTPTRRAFDPTVTPRLTATPSLTPTPIFYDLPAWVSDSMIDVLLLNTADNRGLNKAVTLFNAQTGERFDIPVEDYVSPSWVWTEGDLYVDFSNSLFADDPPKVKHQIQATTGQIIPYENTTAFVSGNFPSPDGRYLVRVVEEENVPAIATLVSQETGEEIELTDPFNGEYVDGIHAEWSPDGQLVSIKRYRKIDDPTAPYGTRSDSALAIFLLDGTVLAQYRDIGDGILIWSPVMPYQILYSPYPYTNEPPYVYDVVLGDYDCIEEVIQWRDEQAVEIGVFNWSPDGNKIGFVYWEGNSSSGFCYVELVTDSISCPITRDDLQVDEYLERFGQDGIARVSVINYQWSPNGKYIALTVSPSPPTSDDRGDDTLAVANAAGELLWVAVDGKLPRYDPWRPSVPLQPEE